MSRLPDINSKPLSASACNSAKIDYVQTSNTQDSPYHLEAGNYWSYFLGKTFHRSASIWGFVDQGIVSITSFAAAAMVGRYCGEEQLGVYSLAISLFWLIAGIPNALVWTPFTSRVPNLTGDDRQKYSGSALAHVTVVAIVIAVAFVLIGLVPWPSLAATNWFLPMCMALAPSTLLLMLREHLRRMQIAYLNTRGLLLIDIPIALMQFGAILYLAQTGNLTYTSALIGFSFPCAWCFVWLIAYRKQFALTSKQTRTDWTSNFHFGRWLLLVSIAWLIGDASFRWVVGGLHGLAELGRFSAAFATVMFVNPIMLTVQNLVRARFANTLAASSPANLRILALRETWQFVWIFGVAFLLLAIASGWLVPFIFGSKFVGLGWVAASLCFGFYLQVLNTPVDAALAAMRCGRAMLAAVSTRLTLILLSGVPLVAWYGSVGVGVALAIGSLGAAIVQWNFFLRRVPDAI